MDQKEIELLAKKIKEGTASSEEELKLLKFLNQKVDDLRVFIKKIKDKKRIEELRNSIQEK